MTEKTATDNPMNARFMKELVRQWRALDTNGVWDGKSDEDLLSRYILTRDKRKTLPLIADPDAATLQRFEMFYNAVALTLEQEASVHVSPIMKVHQEGFGRVVLVAGRLVVISKYFRDIHRFGFETLELLAAEGERLVREGLEMISQFPEAANFA